jgi:hypothetical protein
MAPIMARTPARRVVITMALLAGCTASAPVPVLWSVEPSRGYTDRPQRLILRGEGFLPSFTVDPVTGARLSDAGGFRGTIGIGDEAVQLTDFTWRGPNELSATLGPALQMGMQPVVLVDPRDQSALLPKGFASLGEDRNKPTIVFESPAEDTPAAPGTRLRVRFRVDDGAGKLTKVAGDAGGPPEAGGVRNRCPVPPGTPKLTCEFDVVVPTSLREGDPFDLRVQATDDAPSGNTADKTLSFTLFAPPAVTDVTPASGGITGGTDVIVRGRGFLPGTRVMVGRTPLMPDGGIRVDDSTFAGRMPPTTRAGTVDVTVETPLGNAVFSAFRYYATPTIESVTPAEAPAAGGITVLVRGKDFTRDTRIYLGTKLSTAVELADQTLSGTSEITGLVPPGEGMASVWAFDPFAGWSALADGFSWFSGSDAGAAPDLAAPEDANTP